MTRVSKIRKAVILAAGLGTRMLPASKAVPKEMLPAVDKPLIQYVVEEVAAAGIEEIIFVIAPGKEAIREHFGTATRADAHARQNGDPALIERVSGPASLATFRYVYQDAPRGQAHAVACAREYLEGEPFVLIFPDDLIFAQRSCVAQLVDAYDRTGGSIIAVMEVPPAEVSQYGVVAPSGPGNPMPISGLVEKPAAGQAPSSLAIVGRYVLSETFFNFIDRIQPGPGGEFWILDGFALQIAAGEPVSAFRYEGTRFDTGRPLGYMLAGIAAALRRPDLEGPLRQELSAMLEREGH
jgi:UTP--glucose-1-phosphate uridylyltransferase